MNIHGMHAEIESDQRADKCASFSYGEGRVAADWKIPETPNPAASPITAQGRSETSLIKTFGHLRSGSLLRLPTRGFREICRKSDLSVASRQDNTRIPVILKKFHFKTPVSDPVKTPGVNAGRMLSLGNESI